MMAFSINRTVIVLATLLVTIVFTIWHSRDRIPFDITLEDLHPHEWIGDKGRSATKSEAIYQKTLERRRNLLDTHYPDRSLMSYFPAVDQESLAATPFSIWDFIPATYNCPFEMQRIGVMGDGGKWVCGMSRYIANRAKPCVVYSFGINHESSFEQELLKRTNCEIWGYDYSVDKWGPEIDDAYVNTRAKFFQAGVAGASDTTASPLIFSIKEIMHRNRHEYIDIMKMDIEGSEYAAISSFLNGFQHQELPIGQLLIEIHIFTEAGSSFYDMTPSPADFMAWFEALEARNMRPVWTEPNLLAVTAGAQTNTPTMAEYSLINTKDKRSLLIA